jgi:ubiquitin-like modifier-activating enzyme ATG7
LDQQCTVTRPGVAPLAASLASELYVSITQHPLGSNAPIQNETTSAFGTVPHQIRGHLSTWEQLILSGKASEYCSACSNKIVDEWKQHGEAFVRNVCQRGGGKVIERVCGLEEVKKVFEEGWDGEDQESGEDWEI